MRGVSRTSGMAPGTIGRGSVDGLKQTTGSNAPWVALILELRLASRPN